MTERPRRVLLLVIGALMLCAGLVRLGLWQLHRAAEKQALYREFQQRADAPRVSLNSLAVEVAAGELWRPVAVNGSYSGKTVLLDNRVRNGVPGYEVLGTFALSPERTVLVDRGWLKAPALRSDWPAITVPAGNTTITGRLAPVPSTGIRLGVSVPERGSDTLWRVQFIDFAALSATLGHTLEPYIVLLDDSQPDGYDRQWPLPATDDGKHRAYAVQWFAMALAVALLTAFHLRRHSRPSEPQRP